ncbi:MAG: cytochrome C biosynthesis protein [Candidatus Marinimicrobia bacterium]|nr:cytochrome C biosynthesis protein [Candidatus Neomarinimicrobiota bacterium]
MKKYLIPVLAILLLLSSCSSYEKKATMVNREINIYPEYKQLIIPCNIAPMNFSIQETGSRFKVQFSPENAKGFTCSSNSNKIRIPKRKWSTLLNTVKGNEIKVDVFVKVKTKWKHYPGITHYISDEPIDKYLSYRLIHPQTGSWKQMGLYERDLTNFKQRTIIENSTLDNSCVNCHHVSSNNAENFMFHARTGQAGGTYIAQGDEIRKLAPRIYDLYKGVGYASWHPNGAYIVFSANSVNGRDVNQSSIHLINGADSKSDLVVYDIENNVFYTDSSVFNSQYWESYPSWSSDGKSIYFCRANVLNAKNHNDLTKIQYNLMKIEFNIDTHQWSKPETIIDAVSLDRSIAFPRISPDGRYLMFTLYDFGVFSIFRNISDLAIYDIKEKRSYLLNSVNTRETESYHSWSSNGKWVVYSSKYPDGECGRPHIAAFDPETGLTSKGFILPQKDPEFYDRFILSFNIPELYHTRSGLKQSDLLKATQSTPLESGVKEGPGSETYHQKKESSTSLWRAG